jgi:hypothetical protein
VRARQRAGPSPATRRRRWHAWRRARSAPGSSCCWEVQPDGAAEGGSGRPRRRAGVLCGAVSGRIGTPLGRGRRAARRRAPAVQRFARSAASAGQQPGAAVAVARPRTNAGGGVGGGGAGAAARRPARGAPPRRRAAAAALPRASRCALSLCPMAGSVCRSARRRRRAPGPGPAQHARAVAGGGRLAPGGGSGPRSAVAAASEARDSSGQQRTHVSLAPSTLERNGPPPQRAPPVPPRHLPARHAAAQKLLRPRPAPPHPQAEAPPRWGTSRWSRRPPTLAGTRCVGPGGAVRDAALWTPRRGG